MLIYLIGMPGSGKTTFGRQLAAHLGYGFTDLDAEIVTREKQSIPEIFAQKGEGEFRQAEQRALIATCSLEKNVIATGGGTACFFDNMAFMKQHGTTMFLDIPLRVIAERILQQQGTRPLFSQTDGLTEQLSQKWQQRQPFYVRADLTLKENEINVETATQKLLFFIETGKTC